MRYSSMDCYALRNCPMNRPLSFFREARTSLGLANGLLYTVARTLAKSTRGRCRLVKYLFVAQPIPPAPTPAYGRTSKTTIHLCSSGDGIIEQFPRPPQVIAKRFADGALCFVAEQAGKFVGFLWIKQVQYCEDEVCCEYLLYPADQLVWDFDAYVTPDFRMSRAFAQLWEAANEFLRERGYHWSISRISAFNAASLAAHRRLGAVRLHSGTFVVIGRMQVAIFSCAPYLHMSIGDKHPPKLDFRAPAEPSGP